MIILQNLEAVPSEAAWNETRGILQAVYDEPKPGVMRKITLGGAGIVLSRGNIRIGIPLAELLALAEKHLPGFAVKNVGGTSYTSPINPPAEDNSQPEPSDA